MSPIELISVQLADEGELGSLLVSPPVRLEEVSLPESGSLFAEMMTVFVPQWSYLTLAPTSFALTPLASRSARTSSAGPSDPALFPLLGS